VLKVKPKENSTFDQISLGEVMLRLDPSEGRVRNSRNFKVWEGGGEYNVSRGLAKAFGLRTSVVTALVENEVGKLLEDLILQGGLDNSFIQWREFDGIGRTSRNGLNFTERGFGIRGAISTSDRGHTAASQLKRGDIDWDHLFGKIGVRWFHTGGVFAGLSESTPEVLEDALKSARKFGTVTSYDLNFRPSLWQQIGGQKKAMEVNQRIAPFIDVMIGNEEDFIEALGFEVKGVGQNYTSFDSDEYEKMFKKVASSFPNIKILATTLRKVTSASKNDWSAIAWSREDGLVKSKEWKDLEIFDRIGGGDSFASGLIFGLLTGKDLERSCNYGAAHGALAMTTPGDTSMVSLAEVEKVLSGASARVQR